MAFRTSFFASIEIAACFTLFVGSTSHALGADQALFGEYHPKRPCAAYVSYTQAPARDCENLEDPAFQKRISRLSTVEGHAVYLLKHRADLDIKKASELAFAEVKSGKYLQMYANAKDVTSLKVDKRHHTIRYRFVDGYEGTFSFKVAKETILQERHDEELARVRKREVCTSEWEFTQTPKSACAGLSDNDLETRLSRLNSVEVHASVLSPAHLNVEKAVLEAIANIKKFDIRDGKGFVASVSVDSDGHTLRYRFTDGYEGRFSLKVEKERIEARQRRYHEEAIKRGYVEPTKEQLAKESAALHKASAIMAEFIDKRGPARATVLDAAKEIEKLDEIAEANPTSIRGDMTIVYKSGRAALIGGGN